MICPNCHAEFDSAPGACPECGIRLIRNISGIIKTSAVLIAAGEEQGFYHSVQDVPEPLRTQLIETTGSANAGTIVIADKASKEQITQVLARREARANTPAAPAPSPEPVPIVSSSAGSISYFRKNWLAITGFVVVLVLAAVISVLFGLRW